MKRITKILLFIMLISLGYSCEKFPEDEGKSFKSPKNRIIGRWQLKEYLLDNVNYIDSFLKVNKNWNCEFYSFFEWKDRGSTDLKDGQFGGNCQKTRGHGFEIYKNHLTLGGPYFYDSIYFFQSADLIIVRLDDTDLILKSENNNHQRVIKLKRQ